MLGANFLYKAKVIFTYGTALVGAGTIWNSDMPSMSAAIAKGMIEDGKRFLMPPPPPSEKPAPSKL